MHLDGAPSESAARVPVVSILIPAYNYVAGVVRILRPLLAERRRDLEILVHDDSNNDLVECAVAEMKAEHPYLYYVRNSPRRGAVDNWNQLLRTARGHYILLVHHDDVPLSERFGAELIAELSRCAWPDALILTCVTHDVVRDRLKPGVANTLRLLIVRRWPIYLWRRNVLGPPAALVIRRDLFEGFDRRLKWLVDVDAYYRFLIGKARRLDVSPLVVVSSTGLAGAISTSIRAERAKIADAELAYAAGKFPPEWRWSVLRGSTLAGRIMLGLEWLMWIAIKASSAACAKLSRPRLSLTAIQRRIAGVAGNQ